MQATERESELLRFFREAFEQGNRAWNRGDIKAGYAALPDELEYRLSPGWPEARVLRSRDEVIAFFEEFHEMFPDAQTAGHEYLEGPDGTLIAGIRVTGSGRTSGVATEMELWQVFQTRVTDDGPTTISVTEFTDRREALEVAGIEEPTE